MTRVPIAIGAVAVAAAAALCAGLITTPRPAFTTVTAELDAPGDAERGRLIFAAGDCSSCHASPGQSDPLKLGGSMALASPFGTMRVPNISPHPQDGIGTWSTRDLANALLSGVSPRAEHYFPAFPYPSYVKMRVADVADLMAYLRTLPPVAGKAPPHELSFPFNIRRFVGFWKVLFLDTDPIVEDPAKSAAWNRGRYLVEAVAHCAECHSSRNLLGGIREDTRFAGGPDPEGTGFIPNITPARLGSWTEADIAELLLSGRTPSGDTVGSSMKSVVSNTAKLPPSDRAAIATYIKSLPFRPTPSP
ncbi:cytochrome c [Afipia sp. P52-10]|uniref:c-type cytochrome n=1 Tax=Afipia sp. P52-10 TaxID=1429916 RepID=UPI0004B9C095|nr:cytochrome c [Afipia sp. P52-10]